MTQNLDAMDIADSPELLRHVDELRSSGAPRVLRRGDEDVAVLTPIVPAREFPWQDRTSDDYEAFRSAAGSWQGLIDAERFLTDNYAQRRQPRRRLVDR